MTSKLNFGVIAIVLALIALAFATSPALAADSLVSTNKPATASSQYSTTYTPAKAFDQNTTTRWSSVYSDPQWLRVDLGSNYNISRVKLNWEAAYGKSYQIQVSNDGTNWTNAYSTTTGDGGIDDLTGLATSGRYVRMNGTVRGTAFGYSLWEMEVYGSLPADTTITSVTDAQNFVDSNNDGGNTVSVNFTGTNASSFECSLTDVYNPSGTPWTACTSPWSTWAGVGNDTVKVRAISAGGVPDPTPATSSFTITGAAPPPPGNCSGTFLYCEDFSGASGTFPSADWTPRGDNVCDNFGGYKNANAFEDGSGSLILRDKREATALCGINYSGAFIGTFSYGSGWPPTGIKHDFAVPARFEARILEPASGGIFSSWWMMETNKTTAQGIDEVDIADNRQTFPTDNLCGTHHWVNGSDTNAWSYHMATTDQTTNWHVYSANVYGDHIDFYVDGARCGTGPAPGAGADARMGLLLQTRVPTCITTPSTCWASGYSSGPAAGSPGPWDMKVDYVKVTSL